MAIALVNSLSEGLGANGGTTNPMSTTGANFLIANLGSYGGGDLPTISNLLGGTWNALTPITQVAPTYATSQLFWCIPDATGSDEFEGIGTSVFMSLSVAAFSGLSSTPYSGLESGADASGGGDASPGLLSNIIPGVLCVSGLCLGFTTTDDYILTVPDPAAAVTFIQYSGGQWESSGLGWQIQNIDPGINFNPTWQWGSDIVPGSTTSAIFLPAGDSPNGSWNYRAQQQ